jgi:hypothetical protein
VKRLLPACMKCKPSVRPFFMLAENHQIPIVIMPPVTPQLNASRSPTREASPSVHAPSIEGIEKSPCDLLSSSSPLSSPPSPSRPVIAPPANLDRSSTVTEGVLHLVAVLVLARARGHAASNLRISSAPGTKPAWCNRGYLSRGPFGQSPRPFVAIPVLRHH